MVITPSLNKKLNYHASSQTDIIMYTVYTHCRIPAVMFTADFQTCVTYRTALILLLFIPVTYPLYFTVLLTWDKQFRSCS